MQDQRLLANIQCRNFDHTKLDEEYKIATKKFLEFTYFQYIHKTNSEHLMRISFFEFLNLPQIVCDGIFRGLKNEKPEYLTLNEFVEGVSILFDKYIPQNNSIIIKLLFEIFKFYRIEEHKSRDSSNEKNNRKENPTFKIDKNSKFKINENYSKQNFNKELSSTNILNISKIKKNGIFNKNNVIEQEIENCDLVKYSISNSNFLEDIAVDENQAINQNDFIIVKYLNIFLNNLILKLFLLSKNHKYEDYMAVCEEVKLIIRKTFGNKEEIIFSEFQSFLDSDNELYFIIIYLFYSVSPINENIVNLIIQNKNSDFLNDETNLIEEEFEPANINKIRELTYKRSLLEFENKDLDINFLKMNFISQNHMESNNQINMNLLKKDSLVLDFNNNHQNDLKNSIPLDNLLNNFKKILSPKSCDKIGELNDKIDINLKIESSKLERKFILENNIKKILTKINEIIPSSNMNNNVIYSNASNQNSMSNFSNIRYNSDFNIFYQDSNLTNLNSPNMLSTPKNYINLLNNSPSTHRRMLILKNPTFSNYINNNPNYYNLHNKIGSDEKLNINKSDENLNLPINAINNNINNNSNHSGKIQIDEIDYCKNYFCNANSSNLDISNIDNTSNSINLNTLMNKSNKKTVYGSSTKVANNTSCTTSNRLSINNSSRTTIINDTHNIKNDWIIKILREISEIIKEKNKKRYRSSYFTIFYENNPILNNQEKIKEIETIKTNTKSSFRKNNNEKNTKNNKQISNIEVKKQNYEKDKKLPTFFKPIIEQNIQSPKINKEIVYKNNSPISNYYINKHQNLNKIETRESTEKYKNEINESNLKNYNEGKSKFYSENMLDYNSNDNIIHNINKPKSEQISPTKQKKKMGYEPFNPDNYLKCLGDLVGEFFIIFSYKNLGILELKTMINLKFSLIETEEDLQINGNILYPVSINQNQMSYRIFFENETERELFLKIYENNILKNEILKNYRIGDTMFKNRFVKISKGINLKTKNQVEIKTYIKSEIKKEKLLLELLEQKDLGLIINFFKNANFPKIKYFENSENIFLVYENYQENPILFFFMNPKSKISKDILKYSKLLIELKIYKKVIKLVKFYETEYLNKRKILNDNGFSQTNYQINKNMQMTEISVSRNKTSPDCEVKNKLTLIKEEN